MKTKEEILDFLEKNNCNQELINDVKNGDGYNYIAKSYKYFGVEVTEFALQQEKAKYGYHAYCIAFSYKKHEAEFTEIALRQTIWRL